jgi:hypothetical protein
MNDIRTPDMSRPGWYPDTPDATVSHYWDGSAWTARRVWTGNQHVYTRGLNSSEPLAAALAPTTGTPSGTAYVPGAGSGQTAPSDAHSAPSKTQRSPKLKLAIAGGVVTVAVGITLAVSLSGGGSVGHGFCTDAVTIAEQANAIPTATAGPDLSSVAESLASQLNLLAGESPSPQNAADLRYAAHWLSYVNSGNLAAFQADKARANAAMDRAGAFITEQCG